MGVSGHFRRSASPAGKVNGHHLIVFCLHTGVAVAGMSRKENVIRHIKQRQRFKTQRRTQEAIYWELFISWIRPQGLRLNSKVNATSLSIFLGTFHNRIKLCPQ